MPAATVLPVVPLASAVRLTAEQVVPESVEQDVAEGADRAAALLGAEWGTVAAVAGAFLAAGLVTYALFLLARLVLFRRDGLRAQVARLTLPVALFTGLLGARIALTVMAEEQTWFRPASFVLLVAVAAAAAWAAWRIVGAVEGAVLAKYRHPGVNDRRERKIRTQTILIRRVLNAVIVVVALAAVLLAIPEVRSLGAGLLASAGLISPNVCLLGVDVTEGPFYLDRRMDRADETEGRPGLPLEMAIQIVDASCRPIPQARVDIWHCDALGVYSNVATSAGHYRPTR